jgi:hypothetical protein
MKSVIQNLVCIICIIVGGNMSYAQDKNDPSRWTPTDIINTESMRSVSISPDNTMVLWTKRKGVKEKDRFVSDLYLTRLDIVKDGTYKTVQLTNGDDND